jgi:metal-responsive CopG/Arc/MetJ family transcriptional regulator
MKRFTVSLPDDLKKEMDAFPDINWAQVAKESIERKARVLEEFEQYERSRDN